MFRIITRVQIAYVGLFVLVCAGVFAYEGLFVWPMEKCESAGGWWSAKYRECGTPVPIWRFTGRLPPTPGSTENAPPPAAKSPSTSPKP